MANYTANNQLGGTQQNLSTTYKSIVIAVSSATVRRIKIYDLLIGTNGTPADNELEWDVSRQTAAGTATSITPNALDPADAAALTACSANATVEGTVTANSSAFYVATNQRASYRWVAAPGSELVGPATSAAGFTLRAKSAAYTSTVTGTLYFAEQ